LGGDCGSSGHEIPASKLPRSHNGSQTMQLENPSRAPPIVSRSAGIIQAQ
jgi:hypothetical protein